MLDSLQKGVDSLLRQRTVVGGALTDNAPIDVPMLSDIRDIVLVIQESLKPIGSAETQAGQGWPQDTALGQILGGVRTLCLRPAQTITQPHVVAAAAAEPTCCGSSCCTWSSCCRTDADSVAKPLPMATAVAAGSGQQVQRVLEIVESMQASWTPTELHLDTKREILAAIRGRGIQLPAPPPLAAAAVPGGLASEHTGSSPTGEDSPLQQLRGLDAAVSKVMAHISSSTDVVLARLYGPPGAGPAAPSNAPLSSTPFFSCCPITKGSVAEPMPKDSLTGLTGMVVEVLGIVKTLRPADPTSLASQLSVQQASLPLPMLEEVKTIVKHIQDGLNRANIFHVDFKQLLATIADMGRSSAKNVSPCVEITELGDGGVASSPRLPMPPPPPRQSLATPFGPGAWPAAADDEDAIIPDDPAGERSVADEEDSKVLHAILQRVSTHLPTRYRQLPPLDYPRLMGMLQQILEQVSLQLPVDSAKMMQVVRDILDQFEQHLPVRLLEPPQGDDEMLEMVMDIQDRVNKYLPVQLEG